MDIVGLEEKCHLYLEKGQKQWDSYFSKWEDLAENEVGIDEDLLIDTEDEPWSTDPPIKKSVNKRRKVKLSVAQKIRKKCVSTLNKKNKENLNVEGKKFALERKQNPTGQNQMMLKSASDEREVADLRMIFLQTLAACANKSGIFGGILSRAFSYHKTMMNDLAYNSFGFDRGVTSNAVNSITTNITLNINSPLLIDNTVLNFSLSHNSNEPGGSQISLPRKNLSPFEFQNVDSKKHNFFPETPKTNCTIPRNCFSENFEAKRKFSRLNFVANNNEDDERIKRFRSSHLDFEEKTRSPAPSKLIKSKDWISSINKKDFHFETPRCKKSLRLFSSEKTGAKNKGRLKLLLDSDDDEEDESTWSSKSSLKIFCTPKSNKKKLENDGMENSDSDECEAIFESVKKK